jgi:hypothetical protein
MENAPIQESDRIRFPSCENSQMRGHINVGLWCRYGQARENADRFPTLVLDGPPAPQRLGLADVMTIIHMRRCASPVPPMSHPVRKTSDICYRLVYLHIEKSGDHLKI